MIFKSIFNYRINTISLFISNCRRFYFCISVQVDDLTRQLNDSNAHKSRLTQENFELQKALQDLEASSGNLSKLKITLTTQLEDMKRVADDESKVSSHFIKMITATITVMPLLTSNSYYLESLFNFCLI